MPIKNPSSALLEAIRIDGVCKETGVTAHWGYHPSKEAQVFLLRKDEPLPKGWSPVPVAVSEEVAEDETNEQTSEQAADETPVTE